MNKRQIKKRNKIINERLQFFHNHILYSVRKNGKTIIYNNIVKTCFGKSYKPFKQFKKVYDKIFFSIDFSNRRDHTVQTTVKINKGLITVKINKGLITVINVKRLE